MCRSLFWSAWSSAWPDWSSAGLAWGSAWTVGSICVNLVGWWSSGGDCSAWHASHSVPARSSVWLGCSSACLAWGSAWLWGSICTSGCSRSSGGVCSAWPASLSVPGDVFGVNTWTQLFMVWNSTHLQLTLCIVRGCNVCRSVVWSAWPLPGLDHPLAWVGVQLGQ